MGRQCAVATDARDRTMQSERSDARGRGEGGLPGADAAQSHLSCSGGGC